MKKVIRLTESDLVHLINQVIKEEQLNQKTMMMKKQLIEKNADNCYSAKKYPQINELMLAQKWNTAATAAWLFAIFVGGENPLIIFSFMGFAVYSGIESADHMRKMVISNSSFKKEATDFLKCMGLI